VRSFGLRSIARLDGRLERYGSRLSRLRVRTAAVARRMEPASRGPPAPDEQGPNCPNSRIAQAMVRGLPPAATLQACLCTAGTS